MELKLDRRVFNVGKDLIGAGNALDMLDNTGTLKLSGQNLFNIDVDREIVDLPNFESEIRFQCRPFWRVVLNCSYRLNRGKLQTEALGDDFLN